MIYNAVQARQYIERQVAQTFTDKGKTELADLALHPLTHPEFAKCPAASMWKEPDGTTKRGHHAYTGGLIIHTAQVLELAQAAALPLYSAFNMLRETVVLAAIWHDFGKIKDYDYVINPVNNDMTEIRSTSHHKLIHHIVTSTMWLTLHGRMLNIDPKLEEKVQHAILAHHGRYEWHSPVLPQSPAAKIIHSSDDLSAKYYGEIEDLVL